MVLACFESFGYFPITSCSHEKKYQALPTFPYCKQQKAGWGLDMRLYNNFVTKGIDDLKICYWPTVFNILWPQCNETFFGVHYVVATRYSSASCYVVWLLCVHIMKSMFCIAVYSLLYAWLPTHYWIAMCLQCKQWWLYSWNNNHK